jgi:hypothetical protein
MSKRRNVLLVAGTVVGLGVAATLVAFGRAPAGDSASQIAFRNSVDAPPPGWTGPVFQFSRDYPATLPAPCDSTVCPWLTMPVDFRVHFDQPAPEWGTGNWDRYLASILDYVRQGQDPQLANEVGFRTAVNGKARWFHVPWMAYDTFVGREFVHGTTNERTAHLSDLIGDGSGGAVHSLPADTTCQKDFPKGFETWAVGVYNEYGGWSIGQAWPRDGNPRTAEYMGSTVAAGLPFPPGTVVAKFLTTNAPPTCVPFLEGSPEWQLNRHVMVNGNYTAQRAVQVSRLVQVDVAVVEPRSPTGWVYGTFAFKHDPAATNVWDQLAPVGIQWGSDPWTFPAVPQSESIPARQSVLNLDIGIYEHFGCNGRLAGPVDNPQSSCISCHASAFAVPDGQPAKMGVNLPPAFGYAGQCTQFSADNIEYFKNIITPQAYSGQYTGLISLDTSLQLSVAFQQWGIFTAQRGQGARRR